MRDTIPAAFHHSQRTIEELSAAQNLEHPQSVPMAEAWIVEDDGCMRSVDDMEEDSFHEVEDIAFFVKV